MSNEHRTVNLSCFDFIWACALAGVVLGVLIGMGEHLRRIADAQERAHPAPVEKEAAK